MTDIQDSPLLLAPPAAVNFLEDKGFRTTAKALANLRSEGGGPKYLKDRIAGRIFYTSQTLDDWLNRRLVLCLSTSDFDQGRNNPPIRVPDEKVEGNNIQNAASEDDVDVGSSHRRA